MIDGSKKRNHQIDFLRGVAILMVLGRHPPVHSENAGQLAGISWYWFNMGWMGVDLFFVLSGFLIGSGLFYEIKARGSLNALRFLVKRAFKIWPGYIVLMLFLSTGITLNEELKKNLIWNWLHLQNYIGSSRVQTWSLAIEEHFYLFLPLVLVFLLRLKRLSLLPWVAAFIAVFCLVGRSFDTTGNNAFGFSHWRMDALFFGVLLAYLMQSSPRFNTAIKNHRLKLLSVGFAIVFGMSFTDERLFIITIGLTLPYLGFGLIMLSFLETEETDGIVGSLLFSKFSRMVARVGFYSYGIYLWHIDFGFMPALALYPMFQGMPPALSWLADMTLFVGLSVGIGTLMSRLVELPMLRLRDKIIPKLFPKQHTDDNPTAETTGG